MNRIFVFTRILQETRKTKLMSQLVGAELVADFGADGFFDGKVQKFCSKKGHLVRYDDGDEEWIKSILVSVLLVSFENAQLPSCGTAGGSRYSNNQKLHQSFGATIYSYGIFWQSASRAE